MAPDQLDHAIRRPASIGLAAASFTIFVVTTGLYLVFCFKSWQSFEEFIALFPNFVVLGFFVGFSVPAFPVARALPATGLGTFPAPLAAFALYQFLTGLVREAQAGNPAGQLSDAEMLFLTSLYFLIVGVFFSVIAMIGCLLSRMVRWLGGTIAAGLLGGAGSGTGDTAESLAAAASVARSDTLRAARIGAAATVFVGLLGSLTTVAATLLR